MLIVTYTKGDRTLISSRLYNDQVVKIINVDSYYLYSDPDKFEDRFFHIITNRLEFDFALKYTSLFFIIHGNINIATGEVIKSELLDSYSVRKLYDGFSFPRAFNGGINRERVFVLDETNAIALSIRAKYLKKSYPSYLAIQISEKISMNIVTDDSILDYSSLLRSIKKTQDKDADYLLGYEGIRDLFYAEDTHPEKSYTQNLIDVIENIIVKAKEDGAEFKGVFINTQFVDLIIPQMLDKYFANLKIYVTNDIRWLEIFTRSNFFLSKTQYFKDKQGQQAKKDKFFNVRNFRLNTLPLLEFIVGPNIMALSVTLVELGLKKFFPSSIKLIEYYGASGKLKQNFNNHYEFRSHWKENKDISSKDSYYLVHYENDSKEKIYLGSLSTISDLQKYKFDKEH